ncbi:hypothetical protein M2352_002037 [Azospirillum fermentarium]|nr:hypothetical protein [Azospirillum fermentarium]
MRRPLWLAALLPLGLALSACDESDQKTPATPPPAAQSTTPAPTVEAQPRVNSPGTPGPTGMSGSEATRPLPGGPTGTPP